MRNLDGWMTEQMDGKDDHQGYYISRYFSNGSASQDKGGWVQPIL
jgi:hypothetical protein